MSHCLQFVVNLAGEFSFVVSIPEFLFVVDSVDGLALFLHLHEQVGVVIGLFGIEIDVGRPIDLEIVIYSLVNGFLVQPLSLDSHLLGHEMLTETGSLTLLSPAPLSLPPAINKI